MITRNVIRIFSTYEFRTECGLLHLGRIYRGNSGGFHFNVQILEFRGLLHLIRIYRGNSGDHPFKYYNKKIIKGSWQDCLLRPWVLTWDEVKMKW
jgi:hypothetical protein